jgi:hypothetical protein
MEGPVRLAVRGMEALGKGEKLMQGGYKRQVEQWRKKNPFGSYVPTEHDVIVATYAKSGTNWMMQIAHQLAFHGQGEFPHIHEVVPWPDSPPTLGQYAIPLEDSSVWMASPEKKRVIKTHLNWEFIPYSETAHYIAVIRDPKDVLVSNYHFARAMMGPAMPKADTWFRMFLSEGFPIGGSWAVNTAGYWAERHRPNVMIASFKAMKQDLLGSIRSVARFLGVDSSDCVIEQVRGKSTFEYMRQHDDQFHVWNVIPWHSPMTMIRKGSHGGSSELLTKDQQKQIDDYFRAELKRLGSDFPYEEFCDLA